MELLVGEDALLTRFAFPDEGGFGLAVGGQVAVEAVFADVELPADEPPARYPVVVANILASALDALAESLAQRTAPGGRLAMSGILAGQEDALLARYAAWFDELRVAREEDWVRIDGRRRA